MTQAVHVHVHVHKGTKTGSVTRLGVCLDRSGSMEVIRDATISGFNEWLTDQKRLTTDAATLTMVKFDTEYEIPYLDTPLAEVQPLTRDTFQPRGGTALNDAIVETTRRIEQAMQPGDRALVLILTDGEENSSREFRAVESVRQIIQQHEARGTWTYVFMRGTLDAQAGRKQAADYGALLRNTRTFTPDVQATVANFAAAAAATTAYRSSHASNTAEFFRSEADQSTSGPTTP